MKRARKPAPFRFEVALAPTKKPRGATGAARGRKSLPQVNQFQPMTPAALKRFLVGVASHSARLHYEMAREHGAKITWKEAIERAIEESAYQRAKDPKTGKVSYLPIFVDDDGEALVTFAAVDGQLFPRKRDRKKALR